MPPSLASSAAMERMLKAAGASRVGEDAKAALQDVLKVYAERVARQAVVLAAHAGRKTVLGSDVTLAARRIVQEA